MLDSFSYRDARLFPTALPHIAKSLRNYKLHCARKPSLSYSPSDQPSNLQRRAKSRGLIFDLYWYRIEIWSELLLCGPNHKEGYCHTHQQKAILLRLQWKNYFIVWDWCFYVILWECSIRALWYLAASKLYILPCGWLWAWRSRVIWFICWDKWTVLNFCPFL